MKRASNNCFYRPEPDRPSVESLKPRQKRAEAAQAKRPVPDSDSTLLRKEKAMARSRKTAADRQPAEQSQERLYTLEVFLFSGPITEKFAKKNPVVSRTIQIRGDQTLARSARGHLRCFRPRGGTHVRIPVRQRADGPGRRLGMCCPWASRSRAVKTTRRLVKWMTTTIGSLGLKVGDRFGYWFDFGDDWWHQINVEGIEDKVPKGKFPKVTKQVGKSPPQYADEDE